MAKGNGMTSKTEPGGASAALSRKAAKPPVFDPSADTVPLPAFDVHTPSPPHREAEPDIAQGIDLS